MPTYGVVNLSAVQKLARSRTGVFWVREMLSLPKIREILSAATVFVCPSVYEPLGIVNLEAMACATAVVASDVGQAFLGSQGDVWDAQWDMLMALIGAAVSLPLLSGAHDRSMARVPVIA